jgi:hypothetical protein
MSCSNCQTPNEPNAPRCARCGYWLVSVADLAVGSVLSERYRLLKPLGKGGMGVVFKAHDSVLEEDVALKLLRSDIAEEPDAARRFRQEIRLARRVRHRNVCAIHEYGEDGGIRYISMELIEGVDLRQVLRRQGTPTAVEALDISIQIAEGLSAIHEAGIIHRDLKTANIMIDAQGCVRLMDFGIAKQVASESMAGVTALGTIMGTPEYMSPEQGRGENTDFRTDVYSLGVMVFEICTGHLPFKGDTPIATIFKHIQEPPPLFGEQAAQIPRPVVPLLAKALAKSPQDRYQSVAEMLQALRDARDACGQLPRAVPRIPAAPPIVTGAVAPQLEPATQSRVAPTSVPTRVPTAMRTLVPGGVSLDASGEATAATPGRHVLNPEAAVPSATEGAVDRTPGASRKHAAAIPTVARSPGWPLRFWLFTGLGPLVIVALALGGFLGYRVLRDRTRIALPQDRRTSASGIQQTPAPAPLTVRQGVLIIDALPWAEIVSVVGENGAPQALGSARYTPAVVHLPEGVYAICLRHPQFGSSKVNATVRAAAETRQVVEMGHVDARQYLREAGF